MPRVYAAVSVATSSSPPAASSPGAGDVADQAVCVDGNGSPGVNQGSTGFADDAKEADMVLEFRPKTKKPNRVGLFDLAPRPGLEPGTYGLTVRRSTD